MGEGQRILDEYYRRPACPVCGRRFVPLASGKVRHHNRRLMVGTFMKTERCHGSGKPEKKS